MNNIFLSFMWVPSAFKTAKLGYQVRVWKRHIQNKKIDKNICTITQLQLNEIHEIFSSNKIDSNNQIGAFKETAQAALDKLEKLDSPTKIQGQIDE